MPGSRRRKAALLSARWIPPQVREEIEVGIDRMNGQIVPPGDGCDHQVRQWKSMASEASCRPSEAAFRQSSHVTSIQLRSLSRDAAQSACSCRLNP